MKKWKYYIPIYGLWIAKDVTDDEDFQTQIIFYHFFGWPPCATVIAMIVLYFIGNLK